MANSMTWDQKVGAANLAAEKARILALETKFAGTATRLAGLVIHRRAVASAYTILATDEYVAVTATATVTLPAASSVPAGQKFIVKSVGSGVTTTVGRNGSNTINGAASNDSLSGNTAASYVSDGSSNWEKV